MSSRHPYLAQQAAQERTKEQVVQDLFAEDVRRMLGTKSGRNVLYHLIFDLGGLTRASYATSGQEMARLEGRRSIAIQLTNVLEGIEPGVCARLLLEEQELIARVEAALNDTDTKEKEMDA